ncbi:glycosyltransferase family 39 protein [Streptomyces sp. 8N114]|uniref:glycosyltransferase family 39 protein n=1 Tax=Streptomyces sp. 8N114 TaxID=3457419 RepID=UPI003FD07762
MSLCLGLWGLRRQGSMWRDEAVTYDMAHRGLTDLLHTLAHYDMAHGLYYLLMHAVFAVLGDGLMVLRLPSVLAMAAATGGVALLGRRLAGPWAGLGSGILFALLPDTQRYAQEGRSYALVCAAVTWATVLLVRAVAERRTGPWVSYAVLSLGACLLHEFAVLAVLAHGVTLLASRAAGDALRAWGAAAACVAAGLAPLAVASSGQIGLVAWIRDPDAGTYLKVVAVAGVGMGCAALLKARPTWRVVPVALPLALVPEVALLLMSLVKPIYVQRYVMYASAGSALLLGAALQELWRRPGLRAGSAAVAGIAAVLLLVPVGQHLRAPASRTDDLNAIANAVSVRANPGDGLLFMPDGSRVWKLPYASAYRGLTDLTSKADPHTSRTLYGTEVPPRAVRTRMLAVRRILVLQDPAGKQRGQDGIDRVKRATLRTHFELCSTTSVQGARVTVYARPGTC